MFCPCWQPLGLLPIFIHLINSSHCQKYLSRLIPLFSLATPLSPFLLSPRNLSLTFLSSFFHFLLFPFSRSSIFGQQTYSIPLTAFEFNHNLYTFLPSCSLFSNLHGSIPVFAQQDCLCKSCLCNTLFNYSHYSTYFGVLYCLCAVILILGSQVK